MNRNNVYIAGAGILSPLGIGLEATEKALRENRSGIGPLGVFSIRHPPALPVAEVQELADSPLPRTHTLAIQAALQAMGDRREAPDAIILGTTTGGILSTEQLLTDKVQNPQKYSYHGLSTVAEAVARQLRCPGKALTVSTACSSGAVAISLALKMLQSGKAEWILAGGADSLSHLTYFGFHSLQLVDPGGSKPFDKNRQGMSVGEGAALLLLTTTKPEKPLAQLLGAGLSCDAYHAAAPQPQGKGAAKAMQTALENAGLTADDIDYISLHGTGTADNDRAEAKAVSDLFPQPPPLSSIKGATGHGLAAAGAIEAVVAALAIEKSFLPANTGYREADPELQLTPLDKPVSHSTAAVLSNSFGFGGNNGCLIIGRPDTFAAVRPLLQSAPLSILGTSCISGAGNKEASMSRLLQGKSMAGMLDLDAISKNLPTRKIRRLKRLSRLALSLAAAAYDDSGLTQPPKSVFMGTGWGALSETYDFLKKLRDTEEQFPSPIDFVGSVHNSAAGQVAIMFGSTMANITTSGGDYSFEQAVLAAETMLDDTSPPAFVLSADEGHDQFSPLFDPSIQPGAPLADGGGGFCLCRKAIPGKVALQIPFYRPAAAPGVLDALVNALGGAERLRNQNGLILAGIPACSSKDGEQQLLEFLNKTMLSVPVLHYREMSGEFASASALAAVMAVHFLETGLFPPPLASQGREGLLPAAKKVLVLGLGTTITAMEFWIQ
ncbi:MAG: beta-ketoacyl synthase chain length factor [Proteobacteria bacterium]|nr:beta-ketoacyl synthase chain length factor [Pseudomonadota bacterium]MBU1059165.1 beta-ketoacyl synthase chain length factor [Pseudomonadota bacterium]